MAGGRSARRRKSGIHAATVTTAITAEPAEDQHRRVDFHAAVDLGVASDADGPNGDKRDRGDHGDHGGGHADGRAAEERRAPRPPGR